MKIPVKSRIYKFLRLGLFVVGFITMFFYFFSIIGIIIGILYFIFLKDRSWKFNGIVLAFGASFSTWISVSGIELAPLKLASASGPPITFLFIILKFILEKLYEKGHLPERILNIKKVRLKPKIAALFMILLTIIPIFSWSLVSLNFRVMIDNSSQILWIHTPSTVNTTEEFEITIEAWDPYERLSAIYKGTVSFSLESYNLSTYDVFTSIDADLPGVYTFTANKYGSDLAYRLENGQDNGRHVFQMSITTPGIHYLKVTDSSTNRIYYSNPIMVTNLTLSDSRIYWGDLHTHSSLSDGSGSLEHNLFYGRYVACLDYMALTDHGEILVWQPGAFDYFENRINSLYEPNKFVTFQGFEWTLVEDGHYTVILNGDKLLKNVNYFNTPKPNDLWTKIDRFSAETGSHILALPHHSTKKEYIQDWTYVNPKYVKIAEVSSTHGEFLFEPHDPLNYWGAVNPPPTSQNGTSIMDALKMGYNLTLYGSSDVHDGHPGHTLAHTDAYIGHQRPLSAWPTRSDKPYPGGLTAVFAPSLTRESIFTNIENRRIYASSDKGRPILDFCINNTSFKENVRINANSVMDHREISIFLAQDGAFASHKSQQKIVGSEWTTNWKATIQIFKNGFLWQTIAIDTPIYNGTIIDNAPISGSVYGEQNCIQKDENYYINEYSNNPIDPNLLNTNGADFYVIRVVGDNGRFTYAGPIWVSVS